MHNMHHDEDMESLFQSNENHPFLKNITNFIIIILMCWNFYANCNLYL